MKRIYLLLPILAGIMFGSTGIFVRTLTENGVDSTTLLFLRFSIAILYIFLAILITDKSLLKLNKEDVYEVVDADAVSDDEDEMPSEPRI